MVTTELGHRYGRQVRVDWTCVLCRSVLIELIKGLRLNINGTLFSCGNILAAYLKFAHQSEIFPNQETFIPEWL